MVSAEATGEPDGEADAQAGGGAEVQPADGACVSATGGVSAVLGVSVAVLGGVLPGGVVRASDAVANRAEEESGPDAGASCGVGAELVRGARDDFIGAGGGSELQRETNPQKVVWIPHGGSGENRVISSPRSLTGAGIRPQILVRRQSFSHG